MAILGQINRAQKMFTGIARFDPHVGKLLGDKYRQLVFAFLSTKCAKDPPELPLLRAKRTLQKSFAAIAFGPQKAKQRKGIAPRAAAYQHRQSWRKHRAHHEFRIRLKKSAAQKFLQRCRRIRFWIDTAVAWGLMQPVSPIRFQKFAPSRHALRLQ